MVLEQGFPGRMVRVEWGGGRGLRLSVHCEANRGANYGSRWHVADTQRLDELGYPSSGIVLAAGSPDVELAECRLGTVRVSEQR